jgi:hypothetical protein
MITGRGKAALVLAAVLAASPALAETLTFKANLQPVDGTGSKASGTFTADYDTASKKLTYQGSYSGLATYVIGANIHGPTNAVVVRVRNFDSPFEGTAIVSEKQEPDLLAGKWFIFLRSAAAPNGALRGQIVPAN